MTKVTDKRLGAATRFLHDILERIIKGSLDPDDVENALRPLIGLKVKQALKDIVLVLAGIQIPDIAEFIVREYFKNNLRVSERFQKVILANAPEKVSLQAQAIDKFKLINSMRMRDSVMLNELGHPKPYTIAEFLALAKHLTSIQPVGNTGTLGDEGYANIFYVQASDGLTITVSISLEGGEDDRNWHFDYLEPGEIFWANDGPRFFFPAIT